MVSLFKRLIDANRQHLTKELQLKYFSFMKRDSSDSKFSKSIVSFVLQEHVMENIEICVSVSVNLNI